MSHVYILWMASFAYALHIVEEYLDGILSARVLIGSLVLGALLMATPIVMLKLRLHPYFKQDS